MSAMEIIRDFDRLEQVEKIALRLVVQAVTDYRRQAGQIFRQETDSPGDIAEDVTREALDALGMSRIPLRLFGKVDYKRAAYVFLPDQAVKVALLVDSKAEEQNGDRTATIQTSQTSMKIRQFRRGERVEEQGKLPQVMRRENERLLTVTIIAKYAYAESKHDGHDLKEIIVACIPNGALQEKYNPAAEDTIWQAGRNAPSRGEEFRVRLSYAHLAEKSPWRICRIPL